MSRRAYVEKYSFPLRICDFVELYTFLMRIGADGEQYTFLMRKGHYVKKIYISYSNSFFFMLKTIHFLFE